MREKAQYLYRAVQQANATLLASAPPPRLFFLAFLGSSSVWRGEDGACGCSWLRNLATATQVGWPFCLAAA